MKVIFLNTWHGTLRDELHAYVQRHREDTDVFCFQESYGDDRETYDTLLRENYTQYVSSKSNETSFGNVMYVRNDITVIDSGVLLEKDEETMLIGLANYLTLKVGGEEVVVCNVHGVPYPGDKFDTPARVRQTKLLIDAFEHTENVIIGGDFNLLPDTQSVKSFSNSGYRNLIHEYKVPTTRNHITFEKYPDNIQYFADYTFVSSTIEVRRFEVPSDIVSDHQPLELEFEIPRPNSDRPSVAGAIVTTQYSL